MKVLIIGGVAAGTKAAAKLKRMDRGMQVTLITKDQDISYAGCGLPYYVGGLIDTREELIVNTPAKFAGLTGVEVLTGREAVKLDSTAKTVTARNHATGEEEHYTYDACILATGASPIVPPLPGMDLEGVFKLRTPDDAIGLRDYVKSTQARRAVVVGGGFIGLEAAENLQAQGLTVTVVDLASQIMPNIFDPEMAEYVKRHLQSKGIRVLTGNPLEAILGSGRVDAVKTGMGTLSADVVVLSIGIKPNTAFLADSGIELFKGTVVVDEHLRTNLPDVYAAGDCALVKNRLTGAPQWSAMGSSANYEGRTLAQLLGGAEVRYPGALGTGVVKLPGLNAGRTGLTEAAAKAAGYDVETALCVVDDKAHYYPGAGSFIVKLLADRPTHKLLGIQVLGPGAVDKMVDIAVTGLSMGAKLEDFSNLDYAYAPPFSTAIHPFVQAAYILLNKLSGALESFTPAQYAAGEAKDYTVLDVGLQPSIQGAVRIDLASVNGPLEGLDKDAKLLLVCAKGKRGYFLQNRLKYFGYTNTRVLEGGTTFNQVRVAGVAASVTPEQITAVKALGFLFDKRTPDKFNGRVITRNGKITAEEQKVIAEAAERFGSGEVTMTTRLTLEIQGVPFENIEPMREFLAQHGLETGGTGSQVRPVVSCKGTTCQYGLIDTFDLSQEIHEKFYEGYHGIKLPHKFKIAVGGCPNNCVKPDLNDLGVVGQRVPQVELDKCRGCKVCQVEQVCPIHVAKVVDGKVVIDPNICNHCGRCVGKCPFHAVDQSTNGYRIYIGGRWGKKVAQGLALEKVFTSREEVLATIEKAILLFREQGITGERFADTVARLGFENVQEQLLKDDLLSRKEENLAAQKHLKGGATC
ncbi:FAD-dependent oxidoreductase [Pseudoflavonifractor sp. MCC625]|uniref:FAD-dependent oxidoreductase n=1 Tax=Pseudoflavonifractor sp. MCC625 TaxID=2592647 RepID=UPI001C0115C2|nr:FAD-dependent oxidoreductase [Pseudoflavonifractor sp. MCC625]MBT9683990.1 4Fe-4S dicluster domain-containing protein [Pseudoflavonifractor sp. MCC625]